MKKTVLLAIGIASALLSGTVACAEEGFTFRNIPWYSSKADTEKLLVADGASVGFAGFKDKVLRLSGIDYPSVTSGKDRVDGGGYVGRYGSIKVAGYDTSAIGACYIYQLNDDGTINKDDESAEFYFGWYEFSGNDYSDCPALYEDLSGKLSSLYGEGSEDINDNFSSVIWEDEDSNVIRLQLGGKTNDNKWVSIGYIASDADERLDAMQDALTAEAIALEAAEREENKEDVSGL